MNEIVTAVLIAISGAVDLYVSHRYYRRTGRIILLAIPTYALWWILAGFFLARGLS